MKIKIDGLPMAYDEAKPEYAARRVAKEFGLTIWITAESGPGGWPEVSVIGTPAQVINALTAEGGWSSGDDEQDAEMVYFFLQDAKEVF